MWGKIGMGVMGVMIDFFIFGVCVYVEGEHNDEESMKEFSFWSLRSHEKNNPQSSVRLLLYLIISVSI